jgi:hypothetical protein
MTDQFLSEKIMESKKHKVNLPSDVLNVRRKKFGRMELGKHIMATYKDGYVVVVVTDSVVSSRTVFHNSK